MARKRKEITWEINENECWICTSHCFNDSGYPVHRINNKLKRISHTIYEKYKKEIPKGLIICHHCDNPNCINPNHLFIGTHADNIIDKIKKNRQAKGKKMSLVTRGENNGSHKLTEKEVIEIRKNDEKLSQRKIAQKYKVNQTTIFKILHNKTWKHI